MPQKRSEKNAHLPRGLYNKRDGYFSYVSPVSGRTVGLGRIAESEAIAYAKWANEQAEEAQTESLVGRASKPHAFVDGRGLLQADFIASKAMSFGKIVGVYFLLKDDAIVYVGRSTDILTRLANHSREASKAFNRAFVVECPAAHMDRLERLYIDKFKPPHNLAHPAVSSKDAVWSETARALLGAAIHRD